MPSPVDMQRAWLGGLASSRTKAGLSGRNKPTAFHLGCHAGPDETHQTLPPNARCPGAIGWMSAAREGKRAHLYGQPGIRTEAGFAILGRER